MFELKISLAVVKMTDNVVVDVFANVSVFSIKVVITDHIFSISQQS